MFVAVLALALARGFLAVAEIVFVLFDFAFDARLALIGVSLLTSGLLSKMVAALHLLVVSVVFKGWPIMVIALLKRHTIMDLRVGYVFLLTA